MSTLLQDLRYALRQLRLAPGFTTTVVLTLALGIGATTAIFTLVHAVMLRLLPVVDPSRLYRIGDTTECCVNGGPRTENEGRWGMVSFELFKRLKDEMPEFEEMAVFQANDPMYSVRRDAGNAPAKPLQAEFVSGNYFSIFGLSAFAGRVFSPSDDARSAAPVVVMSYRVWQQEYGADPSIVGSAFDIQGHPFIVIGIAPPGFFGDTVRDSPPALWIPLQQEPMLLGSSSLLDQTIPNWLRPIGRLKAGASTEGLSARATAILLNWIPDSGLGALIPPTQRALFDDMIKKQRLVVAPAGGGVAQMEADYGKSLKVLLLICLALLLITCANIANLQLARAAGRRHQASLQLALGAARSRLIRQALTESIVLASFGGAAGILLAVAGTRLILAMEFANAHFIPINSMPSLPILLFAIALTFLTGALFGTAPAWMATRSNPIEALRGANRRTRDATSLPQKALVVVQVLLSVVLLTGAGMLVHSLRNLEHRDFGMDTANGVMVEINQPPASYTPERLQSLYQRLQQRLEEVPGVEHAALALYTPYTDNWGESIVVQGKDPASFGKDSGASWDRVSAGYFETLGQAVLRGRGIEREDTATTRGVAVVNETFANRFFKGEDPIGHHFGMDELAYAGSFEIVGIVRDVKYTELQEPTQAMFFVPLAQTTAYPSKLMMSVETRSHFIHSVALVYHGSLDQLEPQLRKAFTEVDPDIPIIGIRTMNDRIAANFDQQRTVARLAGLFSGLALLLAAVGLYGVTAYSVTRRTGEIGVRMALGANRGHVVRMVVRGAMLQMGVGMAIGIPAALIAARLLSAQLFEVNGWDPQPLLLALVLIAACAAAAAIIPARRAAWLNPTEALRTE